MKLYSHGIKVSLVQTTHRQHEKAKECILSLAADIDEVLEAQIDLAVGFTDADFGNLGELTLLRIASACRDKGTTWSQPVFILAAGILQRLVSQSTSLHSI